MQPTRLLWEEVQNLVAADTTTLAAVAAMHVHLVKVPFVPSLDRALAGLTFATFTGSAPLNAGTGTQTVYYDPISGLRVIEIKSPLGGWTWLCTVTPGVAETIYGYALTDNADAVLLGCGLLAPPIPISAAGQGLVIPTIALNFQLSSPN